jgi:hypothetical protein
MALTQGFFKEEKLDVTVKWVASGKELLRAFEDGKMAAAALGDFVLVSELLAVSFWQTTDKAFACLGVVGRDADAYVAVSRAEINTSQDLAGKTVGTRLGSTSAWFLGEYLRAHQMKERDVRLRDVPSDAVTTWDLDRGEVDVFFTVEPYAAQALRTSRTASVAWGRPRLHARVHSFRGAGNVVFSGDQPECPNLCPLRSIWRRAPPRPAAKPRLISSSPRGCFKRFEDHQTGRCGLPLHRALLGLDRVTLDDFHEVARG